MQYSDIDDAVLLTQEKLVKRGAFVDLQTDLQDHVAVRQLWKGQSKQFAGGDGWDFQLQTDHNYSARTVGLYETDGSSFTDTMVTGSVDPRHVNAHYEYDQREPAFQRGGTKIVDLIKTKYTGMMVSLYELLEEILWGKPATSADNKTPYGIEYWVVKAATEGFYGMNPSGFSSGRAGISTGSSTPGDTAGSVARWANYTARYVAISRQDLVRKMRRAGRLTKFRSVVDHAKPTLGAARKGIYTNDSVIGILEEILEENNMSLGNDLNSKDGETVFKGTPITYAPYLDNDDQNPVYMLNWKWLAVGVLSGWQNQLTKPYMVPGKHLVRRIDVDLTMQMICTNLRAQTVIATA